MQIKTEINDIDNALENFIIIEKGLKTEIDIQDKDKVKINKVKNHIKSSTNSNKLNNLLENYKYNRALNIPIDNIIGKKIIKKIYLIIEITLTLVIINHLIKFKNINTLILDCF